MEVRQGCVCSCLPSYAKSINRRIMAHIGLDIKQDPICKKTKAKKTPEGGGMLKW
jgi:predicted secreted Zn-dependent protease